MGGSASTPQVPCRHPVPAGKTRVCVAGFKISPYTGRSRSMAAEIAKALPAEYESWFYFDSGDHYYAFLKTTFDPVPFPPHLKGHQSSPFVWLERTENNTIEPIGGNEHFSKWILAQPGLVEKVPGLKELATNSVGFGDVFHNGKDAPQSTADVKPRDEVKKSE